jgi:site-specific DNA-methyltransferase (adenine-specific)
MKNIADESVDAIITDPPYGTTACKWDSIIPLEPMWGQLKRVIKPYGAIVLFGKEPFSSALRISNIGDYKYDWYWNKDTKSNFPQANHQPLNNIENILVFSEGYARNFPKGSEKLKEIMPYNPQFKEGEEYKIPKPTKTTEIFGINHKNGMYKHDEKRDTKKRFPFVTIKMNAVKGKEKYHPTQKPVALMEYLIKTYTNEGETVLDFTMGSGTTGVACVNTNRNFIGIEKDDKYFEIAQDRINYAAAGKSQDEKN